MLITLELLFLSSLPFITEKFIVGQDEDVPIQVLKIFKISSNTSIVEKINLFFLPLAWLLPRLRKVATYLLE